MTRHDDKNFLKSRITLVLDKI